MTKIKKSIVLTAIVVCALCACLLSFASCQSQKEPSYNIKDYVIELPYKDNFQVLQLSDTHWKGSDDWTDNENFIKKTVYNNEIPGGKPDFIVITGDCVNYGTVEDWQKYCEFFDSLNIPWTCTFGNHDARALASLEEITSMLNERSKSSNSYLKFYNNIGDSVFGDANFAINLKQDDKIKEQIIIFDTNKYRVQADDIQYSGEDYIRPDQVDWYKKLVNWTTEQNGGQVVPSIAFFHIPLQEFLFAYEDVLRGKNNFLDEGRLNERICCSRENAGLFQAMKDLGSTKGVFCGHDHINNMNIDYQGIKLVYGLKSSVNNYYDNEWLGGRLITFNGNNDFDIKIVRVNK